MVREWPLLKASGPCMEEERSRAETENEDQARCVRQNVTKNQGLEVSQIGVASTIRSLQGNGCRERAKVLGACDRLQFENLKKQVKEYKETLANLQRIQTRVLEKVEDLPRHCKWECVSKVLTDVVSSFLIGGDKDYYMYPSDVDLVPRILASFGIKMEQQHEVEQFLTEWGRGGQEGLMQRVHDNIRDRRGAILRVLRDEFYRNLDSPKPRDGDEVKLNEWKELLSRLKRGREWRMSFDGDVVDPWNSKAVHHSIARALNGIQFDRGPAVTISLPQAGFFLYNLQLAMDGRVMEASRMYLHHKGMKEMEEKNRLQRHEMKRILVLVD